VHYVILRPGLEVAIDRATSRPPLTPGSHPLTDTGTIRQMWTQFQNLGPLEGHIIDNGAQDPEETATVVWTRVRERHRPSLDAVDLGRPCPSALSTLSAGDELGQQRNRRVSLCEPAVVHTETGEEAGGAHHDGATTQRREHLEPKQIGEGATQPGS